MELVFLDEVLEVADGVAAEALEVLADLVELLEDALDLLAVLVDVEEGDAADRDAEEHLDVGVRDRAHEAVGEGLEALVDLGLDGLGGGALLDALVDALLDEDLDEGLAVLLVEELALADLELALVEGEELVDVGAQDVRDGGLDGAVVLQHRHVGGEGALAVGGGVELLDRLLRVGAGDEREDDLGVVARAVVDRLDRHLLRAGGALDRGDERLGRLAVGQLGHDDLLRAAILAQLELRAHADAPVAVLVAGAVGEAAGGEVREEPRLGLRVFDELDLGAQQLDEVVREDVGRHADGDAVGAEHQQERELAREQDRLLVAAVVARDVLRGLLVEDLVAREVREAALDVARGGGLVAGVDVAEVALALDEVALVGEVHERAVDRGVAVRVVEHRAPDDGGDLDEAAVVHLGERVQDAALDGLEAVLDGRDGAVADRVGGELEEVVVHHPRERAAVSRGEGAGVGRRRGVVVRMLNAEC